MPNFTVRCRLRPPPFVPTSSHERSRQLTQVPTGHNPFAHCCAAAACCTPPKRSETPPTSEFHQQLKRPCIPLIDAFLQIAKSTPCLISPSHRRVHVSALTPLQFLGPDHHLMPLLPTPAESLRRCERVREECCATLPPAGRSLGHAHPACPEDWLCLFALGGAHPSELWHRASIGSDRICCASCGPCCKHLPFLTLLFLTRSLLLSIQFIWEQRRQASGHPLPTLHQGVSLAGWAG